MIYHDWHEQIGLGNSHRLILDLVPIGASVLDLGCSTGYLASAMVDQRGARVLGVELEEAASELARSKGLEVLTGSLMDARVLTQVASRGPFDVAVAADVLEHLTNWEEVLAWIRKDVLTKDGRLIASIPNVANYTIRKQLLMGRFQYSERGILDQTHVRFFTADTLKSALARNHFEIEEWRIAADTYPLDRYFQGVAAFRSAKRQINRLLRALYPNLVAFQFVFSARPDPPWRSPG